MYLLSGFLLLFSPRYSLPLHLSPFFTLLLSDKVLGQNGSGQNGSGQNGSGQNGTNKMVYGQNGIRQNGRDKNAKSDGDGGGHDDAMV